MNEDNKRVVIISIVALLVVVGGMFGLAYYMKDKDMTTDEPPVVVEEESPYDDITRVDAKHFFEDGTHTVVGEVFLPSVCDLLDAETMIAESFPEQVTIELSVINNSTTECEPATEPQRFMVTFDADAEATIDARFMGRDIVLNLLPPAEGETPLDFDLFIKG